MGVIDDAVRLRGQRNYTALLNAMSEVTQVRMAELMGVTESTVSDLKKLAERTSYLLAAAGLKVVDQHQHTYDPEHLHALRVLARVGIEAEPQPSGFGDL